MICISIINKYSYYVGELIQTSKSIPFQITRAQFQKYNDNERPVNPVCAPSSSGYVDSGESMMTTAFIPAKLQKDLIQLLDRDTFGVSNWKNLAERLGYNLQLIRWWDRRRIESPTEKLLMYWESSVDYERPEDGLAFLQQKLCEIGRQDAAKMIKEHLKSQRKLSSTVTMV